VTQRHKERPMSDKLDDLATEIEDAVLTTEELEDKPGDMSPNKISKMKDALEKAKDVADDLDNDEE
jgi:hypothetical protein